MPQINCDNLKVYTIMRMYNDVVKSGKAMPQIIRDNPFTITMSLLFLQNFNLIKYN